MDDTNDHESAANLVNSCSSEEDRSNCTTDTEKRLWEKCNRLLQSDKRVTKPYVLSTMIHIIVLIFVTISVRIYYVHILRIAIEAEPSIMIYSNEKCEAYYKHYDKTF